MINYLSWWNSNIEFNGNYDIDIMIDQRCNFNNDNKKIIILMEPYEYIKNIYEFVRKNYDKYDLIITFDDILLNLTPKAKKYIFGSSWVNSNSNIDLKKNIISFIVGGKDFLPGHLIRHIICDNKDKIIHNYEFYNSKACAYNKAQNCKILENQKDEMFKEAKYHICIENSIQINYITEKIIDCFNTMTVPIYWGCPNIGDFFNLNGIIILESDDIEYIINKINSINLEEFYNNNLNAIKENFETCKKYLNYNDQIICIIKDYIKNN